MYSFIVLATAIMMVNYDCTVITIVNYNGKTFIVQAQDETNWSGWFVFSEEFREKVRLQARAANEDKN